MKLIVFGAPGGNLLRRDLYDYDDAKKFQPSKELTFSVAKSVNIVGHTVRVTGDLVNPSKHDLRAVLFSAPSHGPFFIELVESDQIKARPAGGPPRPSAPPPPPLEIIVPAQTTVRFNGAVDLATYQYTGSPEVTVKWSLLYWNDPKPSGVITIKLPAY